MRELIHDLSVYLNAVFREGLQWLFTVFDLFGILVLVSPSLAGCLGQYESLVRAAGILIISSSFVSANFLAYRKLYVEGADIRLTLGQQHLGPPTGTRRVFREIGTSNRGFNEQGLPGWASLYAVIEMANIGYEEGVLYVEFDMARSKLPDLLDPSEGKYDFRSLVSVAARDSTYQDMFVDIPWSVEDPHSFARGLKELIDLGKRYKLVFRYWTKRVDGQTRPRTLEIEGDFKQLYDEVLKHWNGYGFTQLASVAQTG